MTNCDAVPALTAAEAAAVMREQTLNGTSANEMPLSAIKVLYTFMSSK